MRTFLCTFFGLLFFCFFLKMPILAFQNPGDGVENQSVARQEIARGIDSAQANGGQTGIQFLLDRLPVWEKKLPARDTSLGNVYHKIGVFFYIESQYAGALKWLNRALLVRENHPSTPPAALLNTLNGLTQTNLLLFEFVEAEKLIEKQVAIFKSKNLDDPETEANLYLADGQLAFQREDFPRCTEKLRLAASIFKNHLPGHPNHGLVQNLLGIAADKLGDPATALGHYRNAIRIFQKNGFQGDEARGFHNMGIAFQVLGKPDSALFFLHKSLAVNILGKDSIEIARNFIELAKVHRSQKHHLQSLDFAQKSHALRAQKLAAWHPDVIESAVFLGQTMLLDLRETEALQLFDQAILASARSPLPGQMVAPLAEKSRFFAKKGRADLGFAQQANGFYQKLDSLVHSVRSKYRDEATKLVFSQSVRDIYENAIGNALNLYQKTGDVAHFESALAFCERSKSAILREQLQKKTAQGFADLPDSVLWREQQLQFRVSACVGSLLAAGAAPDSQKLELNRQVETAKSEQETFGETLDKRFPKYFELKYATVKSLTINDLQKKLTDGAVLLEYFLGDSSVFVFSVSKTNFQFREEKNRAEIVQNIHAVLGNIAAENDSSSLKFCAAAHFLYEKLVAAPLGFLENAGQKFSQKPSGNFSENLKIERLRIVPDGVLALVPFDALLTEKSSGLDFGAPFLIKKYAISLMHSNRVLLEKPPEKQWFGRPKSAVFAIDYADDPRIFEDKSHPVAGFSPAVLPFSGQEMAAVQSQLGGKTYQNRAATATDFLWELENSEILHVCSHGLSDAKNPLLSGLLFSKGNPSDTSENLLTVAKIYGRAAKTRFVFLSSCNTGSGQVIESEGIMSFSRALSSAGVSGQVMSLWEISDRSMSQIAESFYRHLKTGDAKDEALRQAKLGYLASCPTVVGQHPFFWAGTVNLGSVEPLFVPFYWKWAAVAAVFLAMAFGAGKRFFKSMFKFSKS